MHSPAPKDPKPSRAFAKLLGDRMRNAMLEMHVSGAEMARRIGITPKAFSNYVNGVRKPSPEMVARIAAALEITTNYLLDSKELLLTRDEPTFAAARALHDACVQLKSDEIALLAELGRVLASRRQHERLNKTLGMPSFFTAFMQAHETLIPKLILEYRLAHIETHVFDHENGQCWISIGGVLPQLVDERQLDEALRRTVKRYIGLREIGFTISCRRSTIRPREMEFSIRLALGAPPKPPSGENDRPRVPDSRHAQAEVGRPHHVRHRSRPVR